MKHWVRTTKFDPVCAALADRHYSRRTIGSPQFMPPGQTIVLVLPEGGAVWGWWRPDPASGIRAMNGLDGWTCTLFRRENGPLASDLILDAELGLLEDGRGCGPDGMLTYVWRAKIRGSNPGCCYAKAGWLRRGQSADGRKDLWWKPYAKAGGSARTLTPAPGQERTLAEPAEEPDLARDPQQGRT